jgi:hypothetical protein
VGKDQATSCWRPTVDMRTDHSVQTLSGFPIYSSGFVGDNKVVLGGGGGAGRSGVKNKLVRVYFTFSWRRKLILF